MPGVKTSRSSRSMSLSCTVSRSSSGLRGLDSCGQTLDRLDVLLDQPVHDLSHRFYLVHPTDNLADRREGQILTVGSGNPGVGFRREDVLQGPAQGPRALRIVPLVGPLIAQHTDRLAGLTS